MKVYFVGSGPGAPEHLTLKAARLIENCGCCVYAGSLVSPEVEETIPADAERHDSAELALEDILDIYRDAQERDMDVVRLHSGDPTVYGAIGEQIRELRKMDIDYEVVPGVSSFQAAAARLGIELTVPEVAQTVILTRTSGRTPMPESQRLEQVAQTGGTLCIFLSVQKMERVAETLSRHYGRDAPVAVVYRASWPDEQVLRGRLKDISEAVEAENISRTALIVVGPALEEQATRSRLYDSNFSHGYRESDAE